MQKSKGSYKKGENKKEKRRKKQEEEELNKEKRKKRKELTGRRKIKETLGVKEQGSQTVRVKQVEEKNSDRIWWRMKKISVASSHYWRKQPLGPLRRLQLLDAHKLSSSRSRYFEYLQ